MYFQSSENILEMQVSKTLWKYTELTFYKMPHENKPHKDNECDNLNIRYSDTILNIYSEQLGYQGSWSGF